MKKIIIAIISAMILMPTMADAQDKWKPSTPRAIKNFRAGQASIYRQGYLYMISAKTNHSWDDNEMSIYLGNGREEAMESINKLIEISEFPGGNYGYPYKDATIDIKDNHIEIVGIKGKLFYGKASITDGELKKMKEFIIKGK